MKRAVKIVFPSSSHPHRISHCDSWTRVKIASANECQSWKARVYCLRLVVAFGFSFTLSWNSTSWKQLSDESDEAFFRAIWAQYRVEARWLSKENISESLNNFCKSFSNEIDEKIEKLWYQVTILSLLLVSECYSHSLLTMPSNASTTTTRTKRQIQAASTVNILNISLHTAESRKWAELSAVESSRDTTESQKTSRDEEILLKIPARFVELSYVRWFNWMWFIF